VEFLAEYGMFAAKTLTAVVAILVVIIVTAGIVIKNKEKPGKQIKITKLNNEYDDISLMMKAMLLSDAEMKNLEKKKKLQIKKEKKNPEDPDKQRVFVLDFAGDIKASAVTSLRQEITAILMVARKNDEVFVRVNSAGGMVNTYGLAASQLKRIKDKGIGLTISVDKVAASGGYMMACVADHILAAPFAIVGSIGVVAQIPNFNRLLKKHDIDYEMITAGEYKRTLTVFGENTDQARNKFKEDINDIHDLFKDFVKQERPVVNIEKISTGEYWFGTRAKELALVDELKTSDDYLLERISQADIYSVKYIEKKNLSKKFSGFLSSVTEDVMTKVKTTSNETYLP